MNRLLLSFGAGIITIAYFLKKYCGGPVCCCSGDLVGKIVILTGGTSGIGLAVTKEIAKRGATVIFTARNLAQGNKVKDDVIALTGNPNIICKQLELNDFSSIRSFVSELQSGLCSTIDLLINNAGIFFHPPEETVDGYDITFQTNYLGHFLLTELLVPKLTIGSRIIFLSSAAQSLCKSVDLSTVSTFNGNAIGTSARFLNYSISKLCLLLYSQNLADRFKDQGITVFSVDPGSVETPIYRHFPYLQNYFLKALQKPIRYIVIRSPIQGSQTVIHCALFPNSNNETGLYYKDLKVTTSSDLARDTELSKSLYACSLNWAKISKSDC